MVWLHVQACHMTIVCTYTQFQVFSCAHAQGLFLIARGYSQQQRYRYRRERGREGERDREREREKDEGNKSRGGAQNLIVVKGVWTKLVGS